jgi:hypothetical protein
MLSEVAALAEPPRVFPSHVPIRKARAFQDGAEEVCAPRLAVQNSTATTSFLIILLALSLDQGIRAWSPPEAIIDHRMITEETVGNIRAKCPFALVRTGCADRSVAAITKAYSHLFATPTPEELLDV